MPADGLVLGLEVGLAIRGPDVPAGLAPVDEGGAAPPAVGVGVEVGGPLDQETGLLEPGVYRTVGVAHGLSLQPGHRPGEPPVGAHRVEGGEAVLASDLPVDLPEGRGQVHDARALVGFDELPGHHPPAPTGRRAGRSGDRNQVVEGSLVAQPDQVGSDDAVVGGRPLAKHRADQIGGHDVAGGAGPGHHGVLEVGSDGGPGVGQQGPRRRRPGHQGEPGQGVAAEPVGQDGGGLPLVGEREAHVGRLVGHRLVDVGLAQLMTGQGGPAPRAVRHDLDVLVEEPLVPEALQVPPHRLHVLGREGPVGGVDVHPEADPLGEGLPLVHVVAHRLATQPGELGDPHLLLDLPLGRDAQLLLHLDLHGQAVGVPPGPAGHRVAAHGPVAAEQVLVDPGPHVVEAGTPVGRRGALVEHPGLRPLAEGDRALEDVVLRPSGQLLGLEGGEVGFGGNRAEQRMGPFGVSDRIGSDRAAVRLGPAGGRSR